MSYPALAIANYFIDRGAREGNLMDPLRIQKLVYIAHGWNLAVYGKPLIQENVEAWKYGPVIPSLYHKFKYHGNGEITQPALDTSGFDIRVPRVKNDDARALSVLERVWELYKPYSGVVLSNLTHQDDTPWHQVWSKHPAGNVKISNDVIRQHFVEIAQQRDDDAA